MLKVLLCCWKHGLPQLHLICLLGSDKASTELHTVAWHRALRCTRAPDGPEGTAHQKVKALHIKHERPCPSKMKGSAHQRRRALPEKDEGRTVGLRLGGHQAAPIHIGQSPVGVEGLLLGVACWQLFSRPLCPFLLRVFPQSVCMVDDLARLTQE